MIVITYVTNTTLDADNMREVKVNRLGVDTQTPAEVAPWGYDGNPVNDVAAAFAETVEKGAPVVLGYFIKEQKAAQGETRLFATNAAGTLQTQIWLHADGTVQLGGTGASGANTNHATQYEALDTQLQSEVTAINAELVKIAAAITGLGGAYVVAPITLTLTTAKLTKIKVE